MHINREAPVPIRPGGFTCEVRQETVERPSESGGYGQAFPVTENPRFLAVIVGHPTFASFAYFLQNVVRFNKTLDLSATWHARKGKKQLRGGRPKLLRTRQRNLLKEIVAKSASGCVTEDWADAIESFDKCGPSGTAARQTV